MTRTYEEAFAFHSPIYRQLYKARSLQSARSAIKDIQETLALHNDRGSYAGKLWAELDAARDRIMVLSRNSPA